MRSKLCSPRACAERKSKRNVDSAGGRACALASSSWLAPVCYETRALQFSLSVCLAPSLFPRATRFHFRLRVPGARDGTRSQRRGWGEAATRLCDWATGAHAARVWGEVGRRQGRAGKAWAGRWAVSSTPRGRRPRRGQVTFPRVSGRLGRGFPQTPVGKAARGSRARVGGTRSDWGLAGGVGVPRGPLDRWLSRPGRAATVICSSVEKVVSHGASPWTASELVSALRGAERLVRAFCLCRLSQVSSIPKGCGQSSHSSFPFIRGGLAHSLRVLRKTLKFVKAGGGEATRGITYLFITYKWAYPYGSQLAAGVTREEYRRG